MNTELLDLETLRQGLDHLRSALGSMSDYLDRGRPDAEQRAATAQQIARGEAEAEALEARLAAEVYRLRTEASAVIDAWIELHLAVLDEILTETAGADYLSHDDVRHFVAQETVAAWRAVADGSRAYVHINAAYLEDYEARLIARVPALNPDVRRRAETLRKNLDKRDLKLDSLEASYADGT
jgi:hypothetical protein